MRSHDPQEPLSANEAGSLVFRSEAISISCKQLERQIVHTVHQVTIGLLGIRQQFSVIMTLELAIAHEDRRVSAHRTPKRLVEYATTARERGLQVIIAGAGGIRTIEENRTANGSLS